MQVTSNNTENKELLSDTKTSKILKAYASYWKKMSKFVNQEKNRSL